MKQVLLIFLFITNYQVLIGQTFDWVYEGRLEEKIGEAIATDKENNVFSLSGGGSYLNLSKKNSEGEILWEVHHYGKHSRPYIAIDREGNCFISIFTTLIYIENEEGIKESFGKVSDLGGILFKYTPDGKLLWHYHHNPTIYSDVILAFTVDTLANVYLGVSIGNENYQTGVLTHIKKLDSDGKVLWDKFI
ncbi:MAG: hypothetical protein H0X62_16860, partial [Bacteroidetes bacterium]|nr:hypothetical protein [Bacteroidota bacterium]